MLMMSPLPVADKTLDRSAQLTELTGVVYDAARAGLPAHALERGVWPRLLQLGHDLEAAYFALAGDGESGATLTLNDGRVVKRLPTRHRRPYPSIFGDFTVERVVYGTREGQTIEAAPLDARLGLPEGKFSYRLQDGDQALAVENPYGQVNTVLARILGLNQSVASLEAMSRTPGGAVAGHEAARPAPAPATGEQVVVLSADGKGVPLRQPADAPAIAAHARTPGPKPDRKKMASVSGAYPIGPHPRTAAAVVESLFRDPRARPEHPLTPRPVPQQKRRWAVLPAAAVAEALAAPRPTEVVFPWLLAEARQRDPDLPHAWVLLMDGQHTLWDAAAATFGDTARVEILDLLHVTGYLWEAMHLFLPTGSTLATTLMKVLVHAVLDGVGPGAIRWLQDLAEQGPVAGRESDPAGADSRLLRPSPRTGFATMRIWRQAIRLPRGRSKAPAATWSRTGWNGPGCPGPCRALRPCRTCAASPLTTNGKPSLSTISRVNWAYGAWSLILVT